MEKKDENNEMMFGFVMEEFFRKVDALKDGSAKKLIKQVIRHIRSTGLASYKSYKPEEIMILLDYWQLFVIACKIDSGTLRRSFCTLLTSGDDENPDYAEWIFSDEFVTEICKYSEDILKYVTNEEEKTNTDNVPEYVYLLRFYDRKCRLLPSVMAFQSEASARAAAKEMVPINCRYEVVSVEIND